MNEGLAVGFHLLKSVIRLQYGVTARANPNVMVPSRGGSGNKSVLLGSVSDSAVVETVDTISAECAQIVREQARWTTFNVVTNQANQGGTARIRCFAINATAVVRKAYQGANSLSTNSEQVDSKNSRTANRAS
jgi:hypothetical protein